MQKLYEAIIGEKNTIYYQTKFDKFDKKGPGLKASWNWPAFFVGAYWALYRKMYGWFFLLLGITFIYIILKKEAPLISAVVVFIPWIVFAIFANSLYQKNLTKKIAEAKMTIDDENKLIEYLKYKGGVHTWVIWVFSGIPIVSILAAIAIPLYLNYTTQPEGTEALSLMAAVKTDVAEYYLLNGVFPTDNAAAGAAPNTSINGKYVRAVGVYNDANDHYIAAYFRATGVAKGLAGHYIALRASVASDGSIVWTCEVQTTAMFKYVPPACRRVW